MAWAPAYATAADLAARMHVDDVAHDAALGRACEAASRTIDWLTGRQFGAVASAEARVYEVEWDHHHGGWSAEIDDVMTTTGLAVTAEGVTLTASTQYRLFPLNAVQRGRPWERVHLDDSTDAVFRSGPRTIEITGLWGWTAVPSGIVEATLLEATRLFKRRDAPFGVAGSPELGNEVRLLEEVDRDARTAARPYWRLSKSRMFA